VAVMNREIIVNELVTFAELDDEGILLNVETGIYFGLDVIGTQIWKLLADGADEGAVYGQLLAEYEVEPDELRQDLSSFLGTLAYKDLIRIVDA
jgi:hypothetical protein